jgi:hypothetical protein
MPPDVHDRIGREDDDRPTEEQDVEEVVSDHLANAAENLVSDLAQEDDRRENEGQLDDPPAYRLADLREVFHSQMLPQVLSLHSPSPDSRRPLRFPSTSRQPCSEVTFASSEARLDSRILSSVPSGRSESSHEIRS